VSGVASYDWVEFSRLREGAVERSAGVSQGGEGGTRGTLHPNACASALATASCLILYYMLRAVALVALEGRLKLQNNPGLL